MENPQDITALLRQVAGGQRDRIEDLLPLVYAELKRRAAGQLQRERPHHTLEPTALVHEAYIKLVDQSRVDWQDRSHFFAIASEAMRRVLIDHARARLAEKRGGGHVAVTLRTNDLVHETSLEEFIALDRAIERLALLSERQAKVVVLRFFGGLNHAEIGEMLKVSEPTVRLDWRLARAWLSSELRDKFNI